MPYTAPFPKVLFRCFLLLTISLAGPAIVQAADGVTKAEFSVVKIRSTKDDSEQPARMFVHPASKTQPAPLLVFLHSWSAGYLQEGFSDESLAICDKAGWSMVMPDFRGANKRPEACASELAVQDVLDAVTFMQRTTMVDAKRIYLVGTSGGGHMSLMMAARAPQLWAGVSAWVPVTDLAMWHGQCHAVRDNKFARYAREMEAVCGGPVGKSADISEQYRRRSPLHYLANARNLPVDINAGIQDGHTGSVPVNHSLLAFNVLAEANQQREKLVSQAQIAEFLTEKVPAELATETADEPDRQHRVLFRRQAGAARVTIFQGGHEGDMPTALRWLAQQRRP